MESHNESLNAESQDAEYRQQINDLEMKIEDMVIELKDNPAPAALQNGEVVLEDAIKKGEVHANLIFEAITKLFDTVRFYGMVKPEEQNDKDLKKLIKEVDAMVREVAYTNYFKILPPKPTQNNQIYDGKNVYVLIVSKAFYISLARLRAEGILENLTQYTFILTCAVMNQLNHQKISQLEEFPKTHDFRLTKTQLNNLPEDVFNKAVEAGLDLISDKLQFQKHIKILRLQ